MFANKAKGEKSMASKITQEQRILTYIGENGSISSLEAMRDLGIMRLSA